MAAGILLYYCYADIDDVHELRDWMHDLCASQNLVGRVRISSQGLNVTVGGCMDSLREHVRVVGSIPLFQSCDFKLDACEEKMNEEVATQCSFANLSVRIVDELVTLGSNKKVDISMAGRHLSAQEFQNVLLEYCNSATPSPSSLSSLPLSSDSSPSKQSFNKDESMLEKTNEVHNVEGENDPRSSVGSNPNRTIIEAKKKLILLDARNMYESRIGSFFGPDQTCFEVMTPPIRQFSDLPDWMDSNLQKLKDKTVLMYCTGGVRCESASSYLRSKGEGYGDVYQLYGGIVRYLEAFPDGGFFKGKNFVFDHRISVKSDNPAVIGKCLLCHNSFDDYASKTRCTLCRMLILVCENCRDNARTNPEVSNDFVCELCSSINDMNEGKSKQEKKRKKKEDGQNENESMKRTTTKPTSMSSSSSSSSDLHQQTKAKNNRNDYDVLEEEEEDDNEDGDVHGIESLFEQMEMKYDYSEKEDEKNMDLGLEIEKKDEFSEGKKDGEAMDADLGKEKINRKLKILCLHGFRQNASSFKGRMAALRKKLKKIAEFVYVNAPYPLEFVHVHPSNQSSNGHCNDEHILKKGERGDKKNGEEMKGDSPFWEEEILGEGRSMSDETGEEEWKKEEDEGEMKKRNNTHFPSFVNASRKYAWIVSSSSSSSSSSMSSCDEGDGKWKTVTSAFDSLQFQTQNEGWEQTRLYLENVFKEEGPFDGVLGFSQGAAITFALSTLIKPLGGKKAQTEDGGLINDDSSEYVAMDEKNPFSCIRFVILCSGYIPRMKELDEFYAPEFKNGFKRIACPSLHVFGKKRKENKGDRQISNLESKRLVDMYAEEVGNRKRIEVEHEMGHIFPSQNQYVDVYLKFLSQFCY